MSSVSLIAKILLLESPIICLGWYKHDLVDAYEIRIGSWLCVLADCMRGPRHREGSWKSGEEVLLACFYTY